MYELKVETHFAAAHNLRDFKGKCENLHGHNWKIEVWVTADELDQAELVMDFGDIKKHTNEVLDILDHQYLNDLDFFKSHNPSSENIARFIYEKLASRINSETVRVSKVSAWESPTACASYIP